MPILWDTLRGNSGNDERKGLGYRYVRDPRSDAFTMAPRLTTVEPLELPPEKEWPLGPTLDQGQEGSCVGHGCGHWINAGDVQTPPRQHPVDHRYCVDIYNWAQEHDEWADTPPGEGTSVLAGAKACVQFGHLKEGYLWGQTTNDLIQWLGNFGPVIMGSLWLTGMNPDSSGFVPITGKIAGGHCYLCYGYMQVSSRAALKFQNSWGEDWGDGGKFYVWLDEYQKLLDRGNWSMCTPMELVPTPPEPAPPKPEPVYRTRVNANALARHTRTYYGKELEIVDSEWGRVTPRWIAYPVKKE